MDTIGLSINNYISFINRESKIHIPQTHPLKVMDISLFKVEVCQIDELFAQIEKPIILDNRDICGIPLTEEWLIKFGFNVIYNKYSNHKYFTFNLMCISINILGDICFIFDNKLLDIKIEYIHQLQNLYFALTQTELKIK